MSHWGHSIHSEKKSLTAIPQSTTGRGVLKAEAEKNVTLHPRGSTGKGCASRKRRKQKKNLTGQLHSRSDHGVEREDKYQYEKNFRKKEPPPDPAEDRERRTRDDVHSLQTDKPSGDDFQTGWEEKRPEENSVGKEEILKISGSERRPAGVSVRPEVSN